MDTVPIPDYIKYHSPQPPYQIYNKKYTGHKKLQVPLKMADVFPKSVVRKDWWQRVNNKGEVEYL
tara:strand:- start:708 stop:902 length:195 start_codon:yes stop_codon:yes gene_type:complete